MGGGIFSTQLLARISTSHLWEWVSLAVRPTYFFWESLDKLDSCKLEQLHFHTGLVDAEMQPVASLAVRELGVGV